MYSSYGSLYGTTSTASSVASNATWIIIAAVLAVVGGIALYFTFLSKKNEGKYTGFLGWMYEFLNFKKFTIEAILKVTYLILAIFITLSSFAAIGTSFLSFVLTLVLGNLGLRIAYEFSLILLVICRNTTDINNKLNKND
jgi:hypothetical protein